LPRVEKIIDLSDNEKICSCCGEELTRFGEDISEKLEIIPQQVYVIKYIRPKYSCKKCKDNDSKVITASLPPMLIPQGIATASSAAYVFKSKFADSLPYYRQEKIFSSLGIDLSRQTMCNWQIYVYYNYLIRLIDLMKVDLKKSYLIGADETGVQVIIEKDKPPGSRSYMWVYRGYHEDKTILLFDYEPNRRGINPKEYLSGYEGYLQTDGYDGYNLIVETEEIKHLACWAHVRRKFYNCFKVLGKEIYPDSKVILEMIEELYSVEKEIKGKEFSYEKIYKFRQKESKPVIDRIKTWLLENEPKYPPKSKMGEAINYTLSLWNNLILYLEDGRLLIDNNLVENAIRPFVIGRKNWLFSYAVSGAKSSAAIYSLIETAKANNKDPYKYLKTLFEKLPSAKTDEDYEKLLPYYESSLF
jgi:transposase